MIAIIIVLCTPFAAGKLLHVGLILGRSALFLLGSFAINGKKTWVCMDVIHQMH